MTKPDEHENEYPNLEKIDFSRMHVVFRSLPLFDDMFLNMQGMNIAINDTFVTEQEYALLHEYIEIEKTPTKLALFVSAQSQMWIFALYELLRTWQQRMRKLRIWKKSGALNQMIRRVQSDDHNLSALIRSRHVEWVRDDPSAICKMHDYQELLEPVYKMTSAIRMNLAKHEVQGKPNIVVRAPGYGRINGFCGALDFELDLGDNHYRLINRRDIAEALRNVKLPEEHNSSYL